MKVGDRRHLVFSTPDMISLLKQAKVWYIDATFKVVKSIQATVFNPCFCETKQLCQAGKITLKCFQLTV